MRPATALNSGRSCTKEQLKEWLESYEDIARIYPDRKEQADVLISRIKMAYELLSSGRGEDCPELDGKFPLGCEADMSFAGEFFDTDELALIQAGASWAVDIDRYEELSDTTCIRRGFIEEIHGNFVTALNCYNSVSDIEMAEERIALVTEKKKELAAGYYRQAQSLISSKNYGEVYYYLSKAADLGHTEAMTEQALCEAYGRYCSGFSPDEAKEKLKKAADAGSKRAKELIDGGFCEKTRRDLLLDLINEGDTDALWQMALLCRQEGNKEGTLKWLSKAMDARQPDALYDAANAFMSGTDSETRRLGREYLLLAAEEGQPEAMYRAACDMEKLSDAKAKSEKILSYYEGAAASGLIDAMERCFQIYRYGTGFAAPDEEKAGFYSRMLSRYKG